MLVLSAMLAVSLFGAAASAEAGGSPALPPVAMTPCRVQGLDEELRCATVEVFENREARQGRTLPLRVVVLPARTPDPAPDPVFHIVGGPGQTATEFVALMANNPARARRDLVFVDQRGTGAGHRLDCRIAGSDLDPQSLLAPMFDRETFRACRRELEVHADLTRYTTPVAADDLEEVRRRLGYAQINLAGGSYGTRFILSYIRRHGAHVRSAILSGVMPFENRNPLYHAASAQEAWDGLVRECDAEAACHDAFPSLNEDFAAVRMQTGAGAVRATVRHPQTDAQTEVTLGEEAFGEAVRVMLYSPNSARQLPLLISRARSGDFTPFAALGVRSNLALRSTLRFGMLMSVVCNEDAARIAPDDIDAETRGTFLGDRRVRAQLAACAEWPRASLPADYAEPLRSEVPVLILSGNLDPATPPRWGEIAARSFPQGLHLVMPGGHGVSNRCVDALSADFLERGSVQGLDTDCVAALRAPPFALPA